MECISTRVFARLVSLFFLLVMLPSCVSLSDVPMHVRVEAAKRLNPDGLLAPLPVRLKIYQLRDATAFNEATFRQLWKSDVTVLGSALVDKTELTIVPGEVQTLRLSRRAGAEFIAVVAVFRRYESNTWRSIKRLPSQLTTWAQPVQVEMDAFRVEII